MGRDAAQLAALAETLGDSIITIQGDVARYQDNQRAVAETLAADRKSTRLNSSHGYISYAVFCLKKKKKTKTNKQTNTNKKKKNTHTNTILQLQVTNSKDHIPVMPTHSTLIKPGSNSVH